MYLHHILLLTIYIVESLQYSRSLGGNRRYDHSHPRDELELSFLNLAALSKSSVTHTTPLNIIPEGKKDAEERCGNFTDWSYTNDLWYHALAPLGLILCKKDYGSDGNCLYHSIAGILKDGGYRINDFLPLLDILPQGVYSSLIHFHYDPNSYFTHSELRELAAVYFIGVNPYDSEAVNYFDIQGFIEKLEIVAALEDTPEFFDIRWEPRERLNELKEAEDKIDVLKKIYDSIKDTKRVRTWGGYDDILSIANILRIDFILFVSSEKRIYYIKNSFGITPLCTLLLFYVDSTHFLGAGIIERRHPSIINIAYESNNVPRGIVELATN